MRGRRYPMNRVWPAATQGRVLAPFVSIPREDVVLSAPQLTGPCRGGRRLGRSAVRLAAFRMRLQRIRHRAAWRLNLAGQVVRHTFIAFRYGLARTAIVRYGHRAQPVFDAEHDEQTAASGWRGVCIPVPRAGTI
jgi:hypothetical protein